MGSIGDVARGLSVAATIKKSWPNCKIGWLVEPKSKPIVELCSAVDEVILFDRGKGIRALVSLSQQLRRFNPDVTLDLQRHAKSGVFSLMSGATRRIGFSKSNAKEGNWIFQTEYVAPASETRSKLGVYLSFVESLGISIPDKIEFSLNAPELQKFRSEIESLPKPILGMVLGSTWASKDWPISGYIQLFNKFLDSSNGSVVLIGDSRQRFSAKLITKDNKTKRYLDLVGQTNLSELISVIPFLDLLVGPDSGPGHLAAALGVKQVTLFGPTAPERVAPYCGEKLSISARMSCAPCLRRRCPGLDNICMRLISPSVVYDQIMKNIH